MTMCCCFEVWVPSAFVAFGSAAALSTSRPLPVVPSPILGWAS